MPDTVGLTSKLYLYRDRKGQCAKGEAVGCCRLARVVETVAVAAECHNCN